jgi:hypothetical protein
MISSTFPMKVFTQEGLSASAQHNFRRKEKEGSLLFEATATSDIILVVQSL